jgi:hypothetical protein
MSLRTQIAWDPHLLAMDEAGAVAILLVEVTAPLEVDLHHEAPSALVQEVVTVLAEAVRKV